MPFIQHDTSPLQDNDGVIDFVPGEQLYNRGDRSIREFSNGDTNTASVSQAKPVGFRETISKVGQRIARDPRTYDAIYKGVDILLKARDNAKTKSNDYKSNGNKPGKSRKTSSNGKGNPNGNDDRGNGESNSNSGGGGGSTGGSRSGSSGRSVGRILFRSGIFAGLVVNRRLGRIDNSPLFCASGWLFINSDPAISVETEFEYQLRRVIFPMYEQIISNKINRYAGSFIKELDFITHVQAAVRGLQLYYTIDNIMAYSGYNVPDNVNFGMEYLRANITADVVIAHGNLIRTLENLVIPHNLVEFIRFMCQTYRQSDAPHSSLIRINVGGMFDRNWEISIPSKITSMLKEATDAINASTKMNSYLERAFPKWRIGKLPPSAMSANFDVNFYTFWHNMNCCYKIKSSALFYTYTNPIENLDSYMDYEIMERDQDVDGLIFSTFSSFIKSDGDQKSPNSTYWGIWKPLASDLGKKITPGDIRESFNIKAISFDQGLKALDNDILLGRSGIHFLCDYMGATGNYEGYNRQFGTAGFVNLQNVSPRQQTEPFNNSIRLLFDPPAT